MVRKRTTLVVRGEDFALEQFTDEERENLLSLVQGDPLLLNLYVLRELMQIRQRQGLKQWTQTYQFLLDTAKTDFLIDQFPSKPRYVYVKEATGTVLARFDSQNEPAFSLSEKDFFRLPFQQLYLTWTAQAGKKLVFLVSNQEIQVTTLA